MSEESAGAVLIATRDAETAHGVRSFLMRHAFDVEWADDTEKAVNLLDARPFDALVADFASRRVNGVRLMTVARERNPEITTVFLVEEGDVERATETMRHGATDFQTRPLNLSKLLAVIERGIRHQRVVVEKYDLRRRLDEQFGLGHLVGRSRRMMTVYDAVRHVAPTDDPVLIVGEPGTGKDLIAQAIHTNSARRDEAFVKMSCAGAPESATESDLFGSAVSAKTEAAAPRKGRLELADRGSLFLDDVGELSGDLQARLFNVLEHRRFQRVGGTRNIAVDVRLIAATTTPLDELAAGRFRRDLAKRLSTSLIEAPALRSRREDIPLLVDLFIRETCQTTGKRVSGIAREAVDLLMRYDWPGNVRELKNVVEGMAILARGERPLDVNDVPAHIRRSATPAVNEMRIPTGATMREVERRVIEETLKSCGYNREACARTLEIGLRTLYRKLKEYGIRS